jgi:hypothetical protein
MSERTERGEGREGVPGRLGMSERGEGHEGVPGRLGTGASLWRHRSFAKLWAGETISQFGDRISELACR